MADIPLLKEQDARILLNSIQGVGPVIMGRLMERFDHDPNKIFSAHSAELMEIRGLGRQAVDAIQNALSTDWLKKEIERIEKMQAKFLFGAFLPDLLNELPDPPIGLYCLGRIPSMPCISIVGTRHPTMYGRKIARQLAYELAANGICIVSGLARGVDSEAHQGALDAAGQTVCFLGSGLDVIYPPENFDLYRKIQQSGAVLSEFRLGRRADRRTFPMRNRLVSGVSLGVVVVESASSGGSMITASLAAEQGRSVFAVPGRIDQPESKGCLDLLRDGATLVRNYEDILNEIAPMINTTLQNSTINSFPKQKDLSELDEIEQVIMSALTPGDRFDAEHIQKLTNHSLKKIIPAITMLEIRGLIKKIPDGKYEAL